MAGAFRSRNNRAQLLHKVQRVPEKEKLKINLSYLPWKTGSMAMPSVTWVNDEFGLGFLTGQIKYRQTFPDLRWLTAHWITVSSPIK